MIRFLTLMCGFLLASCAAEVARVQTSEETVARRLDYPYESSETCSACHSPIYQQYQVSEHSRSFSNPLFQAQYFNEVVPRAERDPAMRTEARRCIYCHAPVVFMNFTGLISRPEQAGVFETGISCDFCHTLYGYQANGDYRQNPSQRKLGPLQQVSHHSEYSGWVEMSDFCGPCHNASNHRDLPVKATFTEWRESPFREKRIMCQDCHMNKIGYLVNGSAEYEQGAAAHLSIGYDTRNHARSDHQKLHTHAFPGAHSNTQIEGALRLEVLPSGDGAPGFKVRVNNERSGHRMPSGSSELRFLTLLVSARDSRGNEVPVELVSSPAEPVDYGIAGAFSGDTVLLGSAIPSGSRLYRSIFLDADGRPAPSFIDAASIAFDNRLKAGEVREEEYYLAQQPGAAGKLTVTASLVYRSAPAAVTSRLGVPAATPVTIASVTRTLMPGAR